MKVQNIVEFNKVSKYFDGVKVLNRVTFGVKQGTIHSVVGENGSGKTTLMSILFGMLPLDSGSIKIRDSVEIISSPSIAHSLGIAMNHQHFMLIDCYTNLQNIILGQEFIRKMGVISEEVAAQKILLLQKKYNLFFDLNRLTAEESVANRQKVEIMKMLFSDAEIFIFDEPTAVLTDSEIQGLLETFKHFKAQGKTVIFISHKLKEVQEVSDAVTVIRLGNIVGSFTKSEIDIKTIAKLMVGEEIVLPYNAHLAKKGGLALSLRDVSFQKERAFLAGINLDVFEGEITAFTGVSGNGQEELEMIIGGVLSPQTGSITFFGQDITKVVPERRNQLGIAYVPGDIHSYGLLLGFDLFKNLVVRSLHNLDYRSKMLGIFKQNSIKAKTNSIIKDFDVRGAHGGTRQVVNLSGGNQQKFIYGREVTHEHKLLVVSNPTRGLDIGAISRIHNSLLTEAKQGKAVVLFSYNLEEVLALADRVIVLNSGRIVMNKPIQEVDRGRIGLYISGVRAQQEQINV